MPPQEKPPAPPPPVKPEEFRAMADALARIEKAMQQIGTCGLNRNALVTLVSRSSGIGRTEVERVLFAMNQIGLEYLTAEYRKQVKAKD